MRWADGPMPYLLGAGAFEGARVPPLRNRHAPEMACGHEWFKSRLRKRTSLYSPKFAAYGDSLEDDGDNADESDDGRRGDRASRSPARIKALSGSRCLPDRKS